MTICKRLQLKVLKKYQFDETIEDLRRCHLNDIENMLPFWAIGLFYISTDPSYSAALWHFRIFTTMRILHTPAYLLYDGPILRSPIFLIGFLINVSMAVQCIHHFKM